MPKTRAYIRSGLSHSPSSRRPARPWGRSSLNGGRGSLPTWVGTSVAQTALIDLAIRQWAFLDSVDAYLLSLPSPVDRRHRRCWGAVMDRSRLAAQPEGTLVRLGLERRAKKVTTLDEYLREHDRRSGEG